MFPQPAIGRSPLSCCWVRQMRTSALHPASQTPTASGNVKSFLAENKQKHAIIVVSFLGHHWNKLWTIFPRFRHICRLWGKMFIFAAGYVHHRVSRLLEFLDQKFQYYLHVKILKLQRSWFCVYGATNHNAIALHLLTL